MLGIGKGLLARRRMQTGRRRQQNNGKDAHPMCARSRFGWERYSTMPGLTCNLGAGNEPPRRSAGPREKKGQNGG